MSPCHTWIEDIGVEREPPLVFEDPRRSLTCSAQLQHNTLFWPQKCQVQKTIVVQSPDTKYCTQSYKQVQQQNLSDFIDDGLSMTYSNDKGIRSCRT